MHPLSTTQLPDGLLMAAAHIPIVPEGFTRKDHLYTVEHEDSGACVCGQWYFYSATCGGVYQVLLKACGISRTRQGVNTTYCPETSMRVLYGINAHCPAAPTETDPHP